MLQNVVYPYQYMDSWERFNEMSFITHKKTNSIATWQSKALITIKNADYNHSYMLKESGKTLDYKI